MNTPNECRHLSSDEKYIASSSTPLPSSPISEERHALPLSAAASTTHFSSQPSSSSSPSANSSSTKIAECKGWSWLRSLGSLELENSGSVARDHLAAERTFLAYVRTSLGCAAAGVALVQLLTMGATPPPHRLKLFGQILGALIELFGLLLTVIEHVLITNGTLLSSFRLSGRPAVARYFNMQRALISGMFPPAGIVLLAVACGMLLLVLITFALMLAIAVT